MNHMEKISKILDIEINKKYIIIDDNGVELNNNPYILTTHGLYNKDGGPYCQELNRLLTGEYKIKIDKEQKAEYNVKCKKRNIIEWIIFFATSLIILSLMLFIFFIIIKMIFDVSFSLFILRILKNIGKWTLIIFAVGYPILISLRISDDFTSSKFISNILDKVFKTKK